MDQDIYAVIMAGGTGTRFWPFSREKKPKQFLDVLGTGKSLLQLTFDRFAEIIPKENILIVSNEIYEDLIKEQLPAISSDQVLSEPVKRNTAPCIAYAAYKIRKKNPNAVMVISPSDHMIFGEDKFNKVISTAVEAAKGGEKLITIGIQPNRPETGYGYIQFHDTDDVVKKVKTFTEKPELKIAEKFLESGDFVWNAGIFVWSVKAITEAFSLNMPEMASVFEEGEGHFYETSEREFIKTAYTQCKSISIDYGIMEKSENVYVVLGDFNWSDLGSWNSLHEIKEKDENDNVLEANTLLYDSRSNYIKSDTRKLIVAHELEGYLIADFKDVLVICKKDAESKFREFVSDVKDQKNTKLL